MNNWQIWLWLISIGGLLLCFVDVWSHRLWRRSLAIFSLIPLLAATIFTVMLPIPYWQVALIIFIELFLLLAAARAVQFSRPYQADTTGKNSLQLLGLLAIASGLSLVPELNLLWLILVVAAGLSLSVLVQLIYAVRHYQLKKSESPHQISEDKLPTVSVCIPARNETHALSECLKSLLMSDYPKLEILVLDDCSQDKTAHTIRSFAHDGVRFIQGDLPAGSWLGKNQACATLAKEARGDILLFVGVDTRIGANSITKLVNYMQNKQTDMLAVLPERHDQNLRASVVFAPLRYFWQLATPSIINVPTTTALWLIRSDALKELGGFAKFSNQIAPEASFAKILAKHGSYKFLASNHRLGVYYAKKWQSQIDTGVRLWYPSLGKHPSRVVLASLGQYIFIIVPYIVLVGSLSSWTSYWQGFVAGLIIVCQLLAYGLYARLVKHRGWLISTILWPVLVFQEIALTLTSYLQYEFGSVSWKGRNVCYPVLAVVLPEAGFGRSKLKVEP